MIRDAGLKGVKVRAWQLVKRDAATGELIEVVEGGDGRATKVVHRAPGYPPETYAKVDLAGCRPASNED